jgi:hypothetical protein
MTPEEQRDDGHGQVSQADFARGIFVDRRGEDAASLRPLESGRRAPAKLIVAVWGDQYIDDFLSLTLPALLAPGNLPAFCQDFDCELVLVTEARLFRRILASPVIAALRQYCALRLLPIDDVLGGPYGVVLTYALARGFADLGPAMVGAHLLFLNADFILADGSYRKLAELILRGERLIVAPSYCTVHEDTAVVLRDFYDDATQSLSIPPRELATLIIAHRHNTIRAKTVNQQLFRIHRYDQFYWYVNDRTLLGRQLPIAITYMRPERVVLEMPTFWDYGAVSQYCPTTKPYVLGDSDDFLMAELRGRATFKHLFGLGWPTVEEIAADWSTFIVQDHLDYGRFSLYLHASDLPVGVEIENKKLGAFVEEIYRALPKPVDNLNHPFWVQAFPHFQAMRQHVSERIGKARQIIFALRRDLATPAGMALDNGSAASARNQPSFSESSHGENLSRVGRLYHRFLGSLPFTKPWHPYHASLDAALRALDVPNLPNARILFVRSDDTSGFLFFEPSDPRAVTVTPVMALKGLYGGLHRDQGPFDLCLCQLDFDDLFHFAAIVDQVRPWIRKGGKIVLFHFNASFRALDDLILCLSSSAFPLVGTSTISLAGSRVSVFALRPFRWVAAHYRSMRFGRLLFAAILAVAIPISRLASAIERRRDTRKSPPVCTSITIEITF